MAQRCATPAGSGGTGCYGLFRPILGDLNLQRGLACLRVGGGMGIAMAIERKGMT